MSARFPTTGYSRNITAGPAAKRNVIVGSLCLIAGLGGVALDAWMEWRLTLGVLLGARFLWVGTVKVAEGVAALSGRSE